MIIVRNIISADMEKLPEALTEIKVYIEELIPFVEEEIYPETEGKKKVLAIKAYIANLVGIKDGLGNVLKHLKESEKSLREAGF